jgi:hypothetical protein
METTTTLETVLFTDISEQNVQNMKGADAMEMLYVAGTIKNMLTIGGFIKTNMTVSEYLLRTVKEN